jgi:hypothetical protein
MYAVVTKEIKFIGGWHDVNGNYRICILSSVDSIRQSMPSCVLRSTFFHRASASGASIWESFFVIQTSQ